jgi:hypothetical protein
MRNFIWATVLNQLQHYLSSYEGYMMCSGIGNSTLRLFGHLGEGPSHRKKIIAVHTLEVIPMLGMIVMVH